MQAVPPSGSHLNHRDSSSVYSSYSPALHSSSDVAVTLNIAHRKTWLVQMQPGAWTRILTNVVGNALKYTHTGHIAVRLDVPYLTQSRSETSQNAVVVLTVEDTGVGMSDSFLADGIFVPFKQEDPHSTGTGLGLSIVSQIARDIGAELKLNTKHHKGTRVTLRIPVEFMPDADAMDTSQSQHDRGHIAVDRFHLLTTLTDERGSPKIDNIVSKSVVATAEDWMGSEIYETMDVDQTRTSNTTVCAVTERMLRTWHLEQPDVLRDCLARLASLQSHILVLAESIGSTRLDTGLQDLPLVPVFIHQPIGPRKLLQAIASDRDSTVAGRVLQPSPRQSPPRNASDAIETERSKRGGPRHNPLPALVPDDSLSPPPQPESSLSEVTSSTTDFFDNRASESSIDSHNNSILLVEDNHINMKVSVDPEFCLEPC